MTDLSHIFAASALSAHERLVWAYLLHVGEEYLIARLCESCALTEHQARYAMDSLNHRGHIGINDIPFHAFIRADRRTQDCETAIALYNGTAAVCGLPKVRVVSPAVKKALQARLSEGGLERWKEALAAIEASAHCRGLNDRNWKASLGFMLQASSYAKLINGSFGTDYAEKANGTQYGAILDRGRVVRDQRVGDMLSGAMEALDRRRGLEGRRSLDSDQ